MKKILFTSVFIILLGALNLQAQINLKPLLTTSKFLKTTIWDISGEKTEGYLYSATDSSITITNLKKDSLIIFKDTEIYRLKTGKSALNYLPAVYIFSSLQSLNILMAILWESTGDFDFLSAFAIGQFIVLPPTIVALMSATNSNFDYILDSNSLKYNTIYPFLEKKSIIYSNKKKNNFNQNFSNSPKTDEILDSIRFKLTGITNPDKNSSELDGIFSEDKFSHINDSLSKTDKKLERNELKLSALKKPLFFLSPYYVSRLHFTFSHGTFHQLTSYGDLRKLTNNSSPYNGASGISEKINKITFGLSITNNIKLNYYRFKSYKSMQSKQLALRIEYKSSTLYLEYILKPVNRILQKRYQFSGGVGLTYINGNIKVNYNSYLIDTVTNEYIVKEKKQQIKTFAINLSASSNLYITKNLSLQARIFSDISPNIKINEMIFDFDNESIKALSAGTINLSNVAFTIGLAVHL